MIVSDLVLHPVPEEGDVLLTEGDLGPSAYVLGILEHEHATVMIVVLKWDVNGGSNVPCGEVEWSPLSG